MRKIWTIAAREYRAMVATKAFILSITIMPILMFGGIIAMDLLKNVSQPQDQRIVVVDETGQLYPLIEAKVAERNSKLQTAAPDTGDSENFARLAESKYLVEPSANTEISDELLLQLSNRVRNNEIQAFIAIPRQVLATESSDDGQKTAVGVHYYAQDSSLSQARQYLQSVINDEVKRLRLIAANIDPQKVALASAFVPVQAMGLVQKTTGGAIQPAEQKDELSAIFLPMGVMMLMFMVIFLAAQPMLESVLEEKTLRIAEVLLGSANPFQLMMGKLIGTVGGSLTVFGIYLVGAVAMAASRGWTDLIPLSMLPWFVVFQVLGVTLYASVFMAVGASVSQLKEAQSMLLPVWMVMMIPFFVWFHVVREPNSTFAIILSLFPPATPGMMVLRLATGSTIPLWQPIAGVAIAIAATLFCVLLAGRIFRIGLLWQGKTPKLGEVLRWAWRG